MRMQTAYFPRSRIVTCLLFLAALTIIWYSIGKIQAWIEFSDSDPYAHADFAIKDPIDPTPKSLTYLDQAWDSGASVWFYTESQGSNLLPYDFFLHLEQPNNSDLFRDNTYLNAFRYLTQHISKRNPHGLPVGFVRDTYKGKNYVGLSCAACHTTQILHDDVAIRIDGAPAASDMESMMYALAASLQNTLQQQDKRQRFIAAVLENSDDYDNDTQILQDLQRYSGLIRRYTEINRPLNDDGSVTAYGYARLDAFGRIYNRVLEHVLSAQQLRKTLQGVLDDKRWQQIETRVEAILQSEDQRWLLARVMDTVGDFSEKERQSIYDALFNRANGPVSYPALWDTPQHDYVQWNGIVANAGVGPMGRNAGQVIGVFGNLEWQPASGFSLRTGLTNLFRLISGDGLDKYEPDFTSSIHFRNLRRVEQQLRELTSPKWADTNLPTLDNKKANIARGRALYADYCQSCHELIDSDDPKRRLVAVMNNVSSVQTDKVAASNAVKATGYAGILSNRYVSLEQGDWLIQDRAPVAALLKLATTNSVLGIANEPDRAVTRVAIERVYDFVDTIAENTVKPSLRRGDYTPASSAEPFADLYAYKARALNGVWATAPYLHNGSVPSLYHLLLPSKANYDTLTEGNSCEFERSPEGIASSGYRPQRFQLGSRQFNSTAVGLRWSGYDGFEFDTRLKGNSNQGHEYAAGFTEQPDGRHLPCLNYTQRLDLLDFLKTL